MSASRSKASSCLETGETDGWEVTLAFSGEVAPDGSTRLCVTAPADHLPAVHLALVKAMGAPLSVLYRQKIDRRDPKPQGHPGRDFVSLNLPSEAVTAALSNASAVVHGDARCEVWVRGPMNDQVVLDQDGTIYCYPDDPLFRDALEAAGVTESTELVTLEDRDYVRHWFWGEADAAEDGLIAELKLTEVPVRR